MNNIKILEEYIKEIWKPKPIHNVIPDWATIGKEQIQAIENLIQENKELKEYANWHIEHLTEDIKDYIDDDKIGNASFIGELKEEREHWKDIIRIMNNEKTYIDYKNY